MCSYLVQQYVLKPLDIEYLRTISFILVIAVVVQFTEMVVNKTSPLLYRVLGIFLPLFAAMRERIAIADVPKSFQGAAIGMITAGLMSLAFMGFTGLIKL